MACNGCNKKWLNSHGSKPPTHRSKGFFGDDGELPHVEEVVINFIDHLTLVNKNINGIKILETI